MEGPGQFTFYISHDIYVCLLYIWIVFPFKILINQTFCTNLYRVACQSKFRYQNN